MWGLCIVVCTCGYVGSLLCYEQLLNLLSCRCRCRVVVVIVSVSCRCVPLCVVVCCYPGQKGPKRMPRRRKKTSTRSWRRRRTLGSRQSHRATDRLRLRSTRRVKTTATLSHQPLRRERRSRRWCASITVVLCLAKASSHSGGRRVIHCQASAKRATSKEAGGKTVYGCSNMEASWIPT